MTQSRRQFLRWTAAVSTMWVGAPGARHGRALLASKHAAAFRPELLPDKQRVWEWQVWMAKLGPKHTGNAAHAKYVEFIADEMQRAGLQVTRERYAFTRWDAERWSIDVSPASGSPFAPRVTSYFPYSGETSAEGVSGELAYAGKPGAFQLSDLRGKVALVECPIASRPFGEWYQVWGTHPPGETFPTMTRPARGPVTDLMPFRNAGAVAVILGWTDISDENAADQYTPFSRPVQGIPGLYVGRETTARLRALAGSGARARIVLEAELYPDTRTDTVIATLPGQSTDETIIVNTHTDGPNALEENGPLGSIALARYFAKLPKEERKRTLVFPLTTGHFASPWVPSIRGFVEKYPEIVASAVGALTVEHLGCREWMDDASMRYRATGRHEWSVALSPLKSTADIMLAALDGSGDRAAVVNPVKGGFYGEASTLARAGIPAIGYIPQPTYLLAGPPDGCIEKLSADLMYAQIGVFAKVVHAMDGLSRTQLKGV